MTKWGSLQEYEKINQRNLLCWQNKTAKPCNNLNKYRKSLDLLGPHSYFKTLSIIGIK